MTECCNSYGKCTQGFNCPARGKSRSEFDANQLLCKPEAPIQYVPRYDDEPPLGYFQDFCEFFLRTLLPWTIGVAVGVVGLAWYLL